jgi:GNAT superfamily N-acetyltransferase
MRAQEFTVEKVNPETTQTGFRDQQVVNQGQWVITAEGQTEHYGNFTANVLHIRVLTNDEQRKELAWAKFLVRQRPEDGEKYLESTYTFVAPEHRGQGLAKTMYQYANSIGNDIRPSRLQTDLGRGMWQGLGKSVRQPTELPQQSTPAKKPGIWNRFRSALNEINDDDELSVGQRIQDYFVNRGYKYLGEGRDQIAFLSPRGTVLKVLGIGEDEREDIVRTYVGFFLRNQRNPHYPRIYNAGDFAVDGETYFVYEMEYLHPVSGEDRVLEYIEDLMSALPRGEQALAAFYQNKKRPPELSEQQVDGLVMATQDLEDAIGGHAPLDLRSIENLGRRKDGQIVIIDPFSL